MKIGVVLSGCGVMDGSEIHESVLALLAIDRAGHEAVCMAPLVEQAQVVNHLTNEVTAEKRNVLVESARIARGKIMNIGLVKAQRLDALIFPGGYGAVKNLCDFAENGPASSAHPDVARLTREMHAAGKPIGAICISPALVAKVLEGKGVKFTIGNDPGTAGALEKMGARHEICEVQAFTIDVRNRIVSTPAYMLAQSIKEAAEGIEKLVQKVVELAQVTQKT